MESRARHVHVAPSAADSRRILVLLRSARLAVLSVVVLVMGCGGGAGEGQSVFTADGGGISPQDDAPTVTFNHPDSTTSSDTGQPQYEACTGDACETTAVCGDGIVEAGETCDDGNSIPGDGCSGTCQTEPGYSCPNPGKPCVFTGQGLCGDGRIEGTEECDDGNTVSGDGCSSTCQVEAGYSCTTP